MKPKINNKSNNTTPCTRCHGTGTVTCEICNGRGRNEGGQICSACNGKGHISCPACNGTGHQTIYKRQPAKED